MEKYITYRELINKFINFLKENNAHKEYIEEIRKYIKNYPLYDGWYSFMNPFMFRRLNKRIQKGNLSCIIDYSFCWADTKQGTEFWSKLDFKWNKIIKDFKLKEEQINDGRIYNI